MRKKFPIVVLNSTYPLSWDRRATERASDAKMWIIADERALEVLLDAASPWVKRARRNHVPTRRVCLPGGACYSPFMPYFCVTGRLLRRQGAFLVCLLSGLSIAVACGGNTDSVDDADSSSGGGESSGDGGGGFGDGGTGDGDGGNCTDDTECILMPAACCECGAGVLEADMVAINKEHTQALRESLCGMEPQACDPCLWQAPPNFAPACLSGHCAIVPAPK